jgi:hypothetical protein
MAISFPASPSTNDQFFIVGKLFVWSGTTWSRRNLYAIIDGGLSSTAVSGDINTVDGGDA